VKSQISTEYLVILAGLVILTAVVTVLAFMVSSKAGALKQEGVSLANKTVGMIGG